MRASNLTNKIKQLLYKPSVPDSPGGITSYLGEMSRDIDETFKIIRATGKEEKDEEE